MHIFVKQRIKLAEELDDRATIAIKRLTLGDIALAQRDFRRATTYAQASLAFFRKQGDNPNIAAALSVIGDITWEQGDRTQATLLYKEALQLDETVENKRKSVRRLLGLRGAIIDQEPPE
jgi:tetratricopeptide (TPR) repeat protein